MHARLCALVSGIGLAVACSARAPAPPPDEGPTAPETPAREIPLTGPAADDDAELSGLAWAGDTLVLLPQYPGWGGRAPTFFGLSRADLAATIAGGSSASLAPAPIPVDLDGLEHVIEGFEGFESIAFVGDTAYATIEAQTRLGRMSGHLVRGRIDRRDGRIARIVFEAASRVDLGDPCGIPNASYESVIALGDRVIPLHEVNDAALVSRAVAPVYALDLAVRDRAPMASLAYRLTDVTEPDTDGRFWGVNYYWPGNQRLAHADEPLAKRFGRGATHARSKIVERLVEMRWRDGSIELTDRPPLQLRLDATERPRNWEGIVRWRDGGFLVVTDKFPTTMLAYVPLSGVEHVSR